MYLVFDKHRDRLEKMWNIRKTAQRATCFDFSFLLFHISIFRFKKWTDVII